MIDELERVCTELHIPFERLFKNIKRPLAYRISLSNMKEFEQLRERHLIMGNRSLLDLIQITWIEHREQAIVFGYRLKTSLTKKTALSSVQKVSIEKSSTCL